MQNENQNVFIFILCFTFFLGSFLEIYTKFHQVPQILTPPFLHGVSSLVHDMMTNHEFFSVHLHSLSIHFVLYHGMWHSHTVTLYVAGNRKVIKIRWCRLSRRRTTDRKKDNRCVLPNDLMLAKLCWHCVYIGSILHLRGKKKLTEYILRST